jgi:hypothetical protein
MSRLTQGFGLEQQRPTSALVRSLTVCTLLCQVLLVRSVAAQQGCSEPNGRLITVSPGVRLYVLDW